MCIMTNHIHTSESSHSGDEIQSHNNYKSMDLLKAYYVRAVIRTQINQHIVPYDVALTRLRGSKSTRYRLGRKLHNEHN